jgi:hypothetical protein
MKVLNYIEDTDSAKDVLLSCGIQILTISVVSVVRIRDSLTILKLNSCLFFSVWK